MANFYYNKLPSPVHPPQVLRPLIPRQYLLTVRHPHHRRHRQRSASKRAFQKFQSAKALLLRAPSFEAPRQVHPRYLQHHRIHLLEAVPITDRSPQVIFKQHLHLHLHLHNNSPLQLYRAHYPARHLLRALRQPPPLQFRERLYLPRVASPQPKHYRRPEPYQPHRFNRAIPLQQRPSRPHIRHPATHLYQRNHRRRGTLRPPLEVRLQPQTLNPAPMYLCRGMPVRHSTRAPLAHHPTHKHSRLQQARSLLYLHQEPLRLPRTQHLT